MKEAEPLFELRGPDGHIWRLFENGRADGFPEGTVIRNNAIRVLALLRSAAREVNVESAHVATHEAETVIP